MTTKNSNHKLQRLFPSVFLEKSTDGCFWSLLFYSEADVLTGGAEWLKEEDKLVEKYGKEKRGEHPGRSEGVQDQKMLRLQERGVQNICFSYNLCR